MKKTTILAGASALALTLGGVGGAVAQAKAPARPDRASTAKKAAKKHAKKRAKKPAEKPAKKPTVKKPVTPAPVTGGYGASASTAGDGTGPPNILDALEIGPGESPLADVGLVTDVVQGLLGQPLG